MTLEAQGADIEIQHTTCESHSQLLQIAYDYVIDGLWGGEGIFDAVEKLHSRGLSFGRADQHFNRYVADGAEWSPVKLMLKGLWTFSTLPRSRPQYGAFMDKVRTSHLQATLK